jgi:predicted SnoaL-like aldol condensation-catalyzing enzyme
MSEQLDAIQEMSEAVLNEDWEKFKTFLTDDIMYKVGSSEPTYGKQAVVDFLSSVFKTTGKLTGHDVRKVWNEPDIITIEMDANYRRLKDDEMVKVACCDVYRMRGNQVSEWRVYADATPLY